MRGRDALVTFEEMLNVAVARRVDFVLHGGDLFHDNKPSRTALYATMELLRRFCFRAAPPNAVHVLNDREALLRDTGFACVNYRDPLYNVALPVFAIHGNHDDATGVCLFYTCFARASDLEQRESEKAKEG